MKAAHLSDRLAKNIRNRRGDSPQRAFAKTLGISQSTLNKIENKNGNVKLDTLDTMCKQLKCDIGELFICSHPLEQ